MKFIRATCFLAALLIPMSHTTVMAQSHDVPRILFENNDFKVYSVRDPGAIPSVSEPAGFGVAVLVGRDIRFVRNNGGLPFTSSSGQESRIVYGTPEGVIPFIDKERFVRAGADLVWVVPRFATEIDAPIFSEKLPAVYKDAVRDDLYAIFDLADSIRFSKKPTDKQLARAHAAFLDLDFKTRWLSFFSAASEPPLVCVKAHTLKAGKEISYWNVWYVVNGWEGEKNYTYSFDKQSSPTVKCMLPGRYQMWTSQNDKRGNLKQVNVGLDGKTEQDVDLEIP